MNQDKTDKLKEELKRLGFGALIPEVRRKVKDQEQLLLAYRDPGNVQKDMPMLCIVDIRLHSIRDEYFIHNYGATMTKEIKDKSYEKFLTRSKTFYSGTKELPTTTQARHLLQQDIFQKQLKKEVKREQKQNKNKNLWWKK